MIYGWSCTKIPLFVPVEQIKWPPEPILYFDWPIFKNLLLWNYLTEFNQTLPEWSMDGPPQKFLILFRLNKQNGRHSRFFILIGRFSKIFFSETTGPNLTKLCKNDPWMVLHKNTSLCSSLNKQYGRQSRFFILIGRFSKIFFYKTAGPNSTKLCKNDYWMVLHKNSSFYSGWINKMAARADSLFWLAEFQNIFLWNYWAQFNQTIRYNVWKVLHKKKPSRALQALMGLLFIFFFL